MLICISSLKDAAQFLRENEALFVEKTKSVTIQGGCLPFNAEDQQAFLEPSRFPERFQPQAQSLCH